MRYALYRITAPILDRIPDISHQPKGWQISVGVLASILVHILLLFFAVGVGLVLPQHTLLSFMKPKPKLQEIEITVLPPAAVSAPEIITPEELERRKRFMDSAGLTEAAATPEKPLFESDKNMKAGSELPARGDAPLPTQDGRKDRNGADFESQKMKLGDVTPTPAPPVPPPSTPAAPAEKAETPAPAKAPDPTLKPVETKAEDEIALATKQPEAPPNPLPAPKIPMRTTTKVAMLTPPVAAPVQPSRPSAQDEHEKSKVDGALTRPGPNGVDAEGTPLGVYTKGVKAAIGSRWNQYITGGGGGVLFPPGSVRINFVVDEKGKIGKIASGENTSSSSYGFTCEKAVRETQLPPPRKGLFKELPDNQLELTFTFTIYGF